MMHHYVYDYRAVCQYQFLERRRKQIYVIFLHFISEYPCYSTKSMNNMKDKQLANQKSYWVIAIKR